MALQKIRNEIDVKQEIFNDTKDKEMNNILKVYHNINILSVRIRF